MRLIQDFFLAIAALGNVLLGVASAVQHDGAFIPDAVLRVTEEERKQSCVPTKDILVVNGTSPGPALLFQEGETVWIRVYNDIPHQNLTMHWHGLTMGTAPFSDGTPQAAQWPIPPGHFFDYELHVPLGMAGTYFYHSHVGWQATSCGGPLIIEDAQDPPHHYDDERVLFIQDVFPDTDEFIEKALLAVPMEYERAQEMVLINGKGAGITDPGPSCNDSLTVINVDPGQTYRVRLIGGTALSFDILAIEDHEHLEVIEVDGAYTERHNTSFMQVGPGQRFSFLLHTLENPEKQQYYLQLESREFGGLTRSFAIINYGPEIKDDDGPLFYPPADPPITLPETDSYWLEYSLRPYNNSAHPIASLSAQSFPTAEEVTRRVNITSHLEIKDGGLLYKMNGYTWNEGLVQEPYLVSLYKDGGSNWPSMERALENDGLDPVAHAFPALMGEVLEIVIQGTGSDGNGTETHPWHAHGAHYWDLGSGLGEYNREENEARWRSSVGHPVKRDTTNLYKYNGQAPNNTLSSWRAWRIRIDHPGVWMIHCHLLPHIVWGMNTVSSHAFASSARRKHTNTATIGLGNGKSV
jgi:L-ascorbate oxidase